MLIPKDQWSVCRICGCSLDEIVKMYGGNGTYKTQCFKQHLKQHKMELHEYFPEGHECPCGVCHKMVGVKTRGANFYYKAMACGRTKGTMKWSLAAKVSRRGALNPMFNKKPWNKGLTKEVSPGLQSTSNKMSNRHISNETKKRQSEAAKKRTVHGHTGYKHSEETKQKGRERTLNMIKDGRFNHTNTLPYRTFEILLQKNSITYEKEVQISYWSFDFYLPVHDIYIEVDGDYFHSNPKIYPNGPQTATQRKNRYRDDKKNEYCVNHNMTLLRFWECDILGDIECVQQELLNALR